MHPLGIMIFFDFLLNFNGRGENESHVAAKKNRDQAPHSTRVNFLLFPFVQCTLWEKKADANSMHPLLFISTFDLG